MIIYIERHKLCTKGSQVKQLMLNFIWDLILAKLCVKKEGQDKTKKSVATR